MDNCLKPLSRHEIFFPSNKHCRVSQRKKEIGGEITVNTLDIKLEESVMVFDDSGGFVLNRKHSKALQISTFRTLEKHKFLFLKKPSRSFYA